MSNNDGEILSSVGKEVLTDIARDAIELLDISVSVIEKDGSCALLAVSSPWCRLLDRRSRKLCGNISNKEAMNCGGWICHEFRLCAAKQCMASASPLESICPAGVPYFSIPIRADTEIIGAIAAGVGNFSNDPREIMKTAELYDVDYSELINVSHKRRPHSEPVFEMVKRRLFLSARMIGAIVENKRAQKEIKHQQLEKQLRANREEMNLLGQFISGVAHEVRNPLNGILAITEALNAELGEDEEYEIYINHIRDQVSRLSDLMRDILNFGKPIEKSNLQPVAIATVLFDALQSWRTSSKYRERKIVFNKKVESYDGIVNADRNKLQQVFINLLENACNHSSDSSEVTISLQEGPLIRITDEGSGIKEENLDKLFKPFFTTRKGGTGLGLGIVRQIIQNHGGEVKLYNNTPLPGCTAEICLPEHPSLN
ncbi:MAG: PocR ligand-binding domain-containing protein [Chitinispirillales bacterium]|nr:PocR ligand-binding domain-containing protein [Chitinispirillales bacterium]